MANGALNHLSKRASGEVDLPDEQRVTIIRQGGWIPLQSSMKILTALNELLNTPPQTRPPNLLVIGDSNNGKTTIFEQFLKQNPIDLDPEQAATRAPVVLIQCPESPDREALYRRILRALFAKHPQTAKIETRLDQVTHLIKHLEVRVLLIDEIHHVLSGTPRQQELFRNALKNLGTDTKISIAAAGIETASIVFQMDQQMTSRFRPMRLPMWAPGKELGQLLATLENRMPLRKPSNLKNPDLMEAISRKAEGILGDICDLVRECAIAAIRDPAKPERITLERIKTINWVPPSKRKQFAKVFDTTPS